MWEDSEEKPAIKLNNVWSSPRLRHRSSDADGLALLICFMPSFDGPCLDFQFGVEEHPQLAAYSHSSDGNIQSRFLLGLVL